MKIMVCLAAITAVVGNCNNSHLKSFGSVARETIEYQSGENQYSVVVVEGQGLTMTQAKKLAQIKAAEMAHSDGYRYITFETIQKTEVVKSDKPWPDNRAFYGNMYKELILDNNFDRDRLAREAIPSEEIYPAYRFVFKAYDTKANWKAVDVCTLTQCE